MHTPPYPIISRGIEILLEFGFVISNVMIIVCKPENFRWLCFLNKIERRILITDEELLF
tara:strand:+ start:658 stop:834 length:177 start_codon:yes stop_codon:yes gene_type:complete